MTGWEIDPGKWEITQGIQDDAAQYPPHNVTPRTIAFERSRSVDITLPAHATTVLELKLVSKGVPYWSRPDLGLDPDDVKVEDGQMHVTIHSLGSVDAPASRVVLRDRTGKVLATGDAPSLKAPIDLIPKTATVTLPLPTDADLKGGSVTIEITGNIPEITQLNNRVELQR